jgi:hypothetical protein
MVGINLPNFVTVGLIAIVSLVVVKTAFKAAGKTSPV